MVFLSSNRVDVRRRLGAGQVNTNKLATGAVTRSKLAPSAVGTTAHGTIDLRKSIGSAPTEGTVSLRTKTQGTLPRNRWDGSPPIQHNIGSPFTGNTPPTSGTVQRNRFEGSPPIAHDTSKLTTGSLPGERIAQNAVGQTQITDSAVGQTQIATDAVGPNEIIDGAVQTSELANDAVTGRKIATDTIGTDSIEPDGVSTSELAASAVAGGGLVEQTDGVLGVDLGGDAIGPGSLEVLDITSDTSGTLGDARIPDLTNLAGTLDITTETLGTLNLPDRTLGTLGANRYAGSVHGPSLVDLGGDAIGPGSLEVLDITSDTSGTLGDARIPDLTNLAGTLDITSETLGTLGANRYAGSVYGPSLVDLGSDSIGQGSIAQDAIGDSELDENIEPTWGRQHQWNDITVFKDPVGSPGDSNGEVSRWGGASGDVLMNIQGGHGRMFLPWNAEWDNANNVWRAIQGSEPVAGLGLVNTLPGANTNTPHAILAVAGTVPAGSPVSFTTFDVRRDRAIFDGNDLVHEGNIGAGLVTDGQTPATVSVDLGNDQIGQGSIAQDAIGASELTDDAVDTAALQDRAVTGVRLALDSVGTDALDVAGVAGDGLKDGGDLDIEPADFAGAGLVDQADDLNVDLGNSIGAGTITSGALSGGDLALDGQNRIHIAANAINAAEIAADAVQGDHISDGTIVNRHLADRTIERGKIARGAVGSLEHGTLDLSKAVGTVTNFDVGTMLAGFGSFDLLRSGESRSQLGSFQRIAGTLDVDTATYGTLPESRSGVIDGASFRGDLDPATDDQHDMGTDTARWQDLYAVAIHTGDLLFEDPQCVYCGSYFGHHDRLQLEVINIHGRREQGVLRTVPVHATCEGTVMSRRRAS